MAYTTIKKPSDYFNTITYTGSGTSTAYTVGFPTDFVWIKKRDTEATDHYLFNKISGAEETIYSNLDNAEETNTGSVTSFDANGFTSGSSGGTNQNGHGYASWNWLANGTGVANTDGSISSTVSANTTSGFSIVTYTGNGSAGATIGHGLGSTPSAIFVKGRNITSDWSSYHSVLGNTGYMRLNNTNVFATASTYWNNTSPDSSVFTVGTTGNINGSGNTYIAYCFNDVQGFSKFGSYQGNSSADGTFVYTGFKPAWVMFKNTTTGSTNWHIVDTKRNTFNIVDKLLFPNDTGVEATQSALDLTSNGFKIRVTNGFINTSGNNYIYMAFAEQPLVGDNPATAR